ncbi:GntR family transcriptional regulator [Acidocella sp.]|uniref:GntR family transcriptional regulator n=1 Tax=Acidocella sp. TaxID=50710 RepID=UPI003CFCB0B7
MSLKLVSNISPGAQGSKPGLGQPEEKETLAQLVYGRLKAAIFDFAMLPGQRYAEQGLAEMFGVSRTPLRLALHLLAHEGFMQHIGGHACWQVAPLNLAYYEDIYSFRMEIEAIALRCISKADMAEGLEALRDVWMVPKRRRETDGTKVGSLDEAFHRDLVALAGNQAMLRSFDEITERIRIIRRLDFVSPARVAVTYDEHAAILDAVAAGQAGEAERLMRCHIEASRVEIRKITLHRLALASAADPEAEPKRG